MVAALTHPGDNWQDQSRVLHLDGRPAALSALISYMLGVWPGHEAIDRRRVGAFGFSAGGFTVLPRPGAGPICRSSARIARPTPISSMRPGRRAWRKRAVQSAMHWQADARIKAVVAAAPALGFAFDRAGLAGVHMPVQLWAAGDDHILPAPFYADAVRSALPRTPEFHVEPGAGHFDFSPRARPS